MYDMIPEHEAQLSSATQKDIRLPVRVGGSSNAAADPPQTLLSQLPSSAEALAASKGLAVAHQSNSSCPGLLPGPSLSQAFLRHRLEVLVSTVSPLQPSLLRDS